MQSRSGSRERVTFEIQQVPCHFKNFNRIKDYQ
jgi:hypothetical protein